MKDNFDDIQRLMREVMDEEIIEEATDKFKAQIMYEIQQQMRVIVQLVMVRIDLTNSRINLINERLDAFNREMDSIDSVMHAIVEWMTVEQQKSGSDLKNGLN